MLKIEFPAENKALALAIGQALMAYSHGNNVVGVFTSGLLASTPVADNTDPREPDAPTFDELQAANTTGAEDEPTNDAPADGRKDQKGVVFNPTFCANAKEPFYSSGAMLGQWKKARGCDQAAYDAWYANEFGKAQAEWQNKAADLGAQTQGASAAAAFAQTTETTAAAAPKAPVTGGELMTWVSERQVAQKLTQADIDAAWAATGFGVADIFGVNAAAVIASVYGILSAKAGA